MHEYDLHYIFELILILIMLAAGVTALAKKVKQPYPIALVIVGALIGLFNVPILEPVKWFITEGEVFNFVIVTLFLPALLGEAALKLPFTHLRENQKPIMFLAFGATLLSFIIIGFSGYFLLELSIPVAFVFAALMSATDPVSVLSIFKSVGVQKRLAIVIEGESLFNDGLAVVLFKISAFYLLIYMDAGWIGFGMGLWEFVKVITLGLIVGGALGYVFSLLTSFFDDYPLEIIFSIILFYGSFLLAESIHASGVIAVVTAALILGNYGYKIGMTPTTKLNINNFWDVAALLSNSIVFLMVGLEITRINVLDKWGIIFAAIIIVLVARSIAVYMSLYFAKDFPVSWRHIINWGGLKGSLSIALVLSLPRNFAGREDLLILAFSVVLFSLLVQGLSVKPLIKFLKINPKPESQIEYEEMLARYERYSKGLMEVERVAGQHFVSKPVAKDLISEYEMEKSKTEDDMARILDRLPQLKAEQRNHLHLHALHAEHEAISNLLAEDLISEETGNKELESIYDKIVILKKEAE
nr:MULTISPECIES: Na+/H+ antiporter [unclassified Bacillus (in: firmicutes)]